MSLRLQLDNGRIRDYKTVFTYGGDESGLSTTYESICGMKWIKPIFPIEGCDHLDCAIGITTHEIKEAKFFITVIIIMWTVFYGFYDTISGLFIFVPLVIGFGWKGCSNFKKQKELIEFRDHGTIGGIKAHKL